MTFPSPKSQLYVSVLLLNAINLMVKGLHPTGGLKVKLPIGPGTTTTLSILVVSTHPPAFFTINVTPNDPGLMYKFEGEACIEVPPSPKFHDQSFTKPVDPSINWIVFLPHL